MVVHLPASNKLSSISLMKQFNNTCLLTQTNVLPEQNRPTGGTFAMPTSSSVLPSRACETKDESSSWPLPSRAQNASYAPAGWSLGTGFPASVLKYPLLPQSASPGSLLFLWKGYITSSPPPFSVINGLNHGFPRITAVIITAYQSCILSIVTFVLLPLRKYER